MSHAPTRLLHVTDGVQWWCPACREPHGGAGFRLVGHEDIRPSSMVQGDLGFCHSSVVRGYVVFHKDCENGWAGKKMKLVEF